MKKYLFTFLFVALLCLPARMTFAAVYCDQMYNIGAINLSNGYDQCLTTETAEYCSERQTESWANLERHYYECMHWSPQQGYTISVPSQPVGLTRCDLETNIDSYVVDCYTVYVKLKPTIPNPFHRYGVDNTDDILQCSSDIGSGARTRHLIRRT